MSDGGTFTISLDFELFWGVRDKKSISQYGANILGVRKVVPYLLDVFSAYGVHCTWATVGLLFFDRKEEMIEFIPTTKPEYINAALSPYPSIKYIGNTERDDPYHYALSLVQRIRAYQGQEIGTHTFSHYYCLEDGQTPDAFRADLAAAQAAAGRLGLTLKSLVFPRNQVNPSYLRICGEAGITSYRGSEKSWIYTATGEKGSGLVRRGCRFVDSYANLSGHHCYSPEADRTGLLNMRSSRFLRPASTRFRTAERLRLARIKKGMTHAARTGAIYHLWWHPHNFGADLDANARFLARILDHYRDLAGRHGMRSLTMGELAEEHSRSCCSPQPPPGTGP